MTKQSPTKAAQKRLETRISKAMDQIEAAGDTVTHARVRAITGGSFREVSPLVTRLKAEREAQRQAARQVPEPPEEYADLAAQLWQTAYRLADETAAAERRGHAEEVARLQSEIAQLQEVVAQIESERDADVARIAAERDAAQERLKAATAENDELLARLRALELTNAELTGRLNERKAHEQDASGREPVSPAQEVASGRDAMSG